jgi:hypothetical protein
MKKQLKHAVFFMAMTIAIAGCSSSNEEIVQMTSCDVENPLADLPWLKDKVDEITLLFQSNLLHIAIYQCTYGDGKIGFLEDRGNIVFFYNCEGETLCIMGGNAGETCCELNIISKELIWEINNYNSRIRNQ